MRSIYRRAIAVVVLLFLATGASAVPSVHGAAASTLPSDARRSQAQVATVAAPDPGDLGEHPVGRVVYELERGDRDIMVDAWFPAGDTTGLPNSTIDLFVATLPSPTAVRGAVPAAGRYPLVVFSHGSYAIGYQSFTIMENLASHGFIVVAPTHQGHDIFAKITGTLDGWGTALNNRWFDMQTVIDDALRPERFGPWIEVSPTGDPKLAAMGHSVGALTAITLAAGADELLEIPVKLEADPRVDAVIAIGPAGFFLPNQMTTGQPKVSQPTLILGGTADGITPPDPWSQQLWDVVDNAKRYRVDIHDAVHAAPSDVCAFRDRIAQALVADPTNGLLAAVLTSLHDTSGGACAPSSPTPAFVNEIAGAYSTAFLQRQLKGDVSYETWLSRGRSQRYPIDYWRCTASTGACDTDPS